MRVRIVMTAQSSQKEINIILTTRIIIKHSRGTRETDCGDIVTMNSSETMVTYLQFIDFTDHAIIKSFFPTSVYLPVFCVFNT